MNSKFYELTKSESKVNKYKELTSIVNENTFEFQKTYPFYLTYLRQLFVEI